jgi:hypothetical protein
LAKFRGTVQINGYPGFEQLTGRGDIALAASLRVLGGFVNKPLPRMQRIILATATPDESAR